MGMAAKETIELQIDGDLLKRARDAGVDVQIVLERALRHRLPVPSADEQARWNEENREAIEASNRYVEEHGLPLAKYRMF